MSQDTGSSGFTIEDAAYSDDGILGKYVLRSTHAP